MADSMLTKVVALRDEALAKIECSEPYRLAKGLDELVASLGGEARMGHYGMAGLNAFLNGASPVVEALAARKRKNLSQADAAYGALQDAGKPLQVVPLMEAVRERGVEVKGADPLANFRSTLSRDERFVSFRREGQYLWWFKDMMVPMETGADLLAETPAPSHSNDKENRHAAT